MAADKEKELSIIISAELKNFESGMKKIEAQTEQLSNDLADMAKVSAVAFGAITAAVGYSVNEFVKADTANRQLSQSLQQQGIYSKELADEYNRLSDSLEKKLGVDGESVKQAFAAAQGLLGEKKITEELTTAVANLAVAKNIDLAQAFQKVTQTIVNGGEGLRKYGVEVSDTADQSQRMKEIINQINASFGGQLDAINPVQVGFNSLNKSVGDFIENIGEKFAPVVARATKSVAEFLDEVNNNKALFDMIAIFAEIALVATGVFTVITTLGGGWLAMTNAMKIAQLAMATLGVSMKALVGATGIGLLLIGLTELYIHWDKVSAAFIGITKGFATTVAEIFSGIGTLVRGVFSLDPTIIASGLDQITNALKTQWETTKEYFNAPENQVVPGLVTEEQNTLLKKQAEERQAERDAELEKIRAYQATVLAEAKGYLDQQVVDDLKNNTNKLIQQKKYNEAKNVLDKARVSAEQSHIFFMKSYEKSTQKERFENLKSSLGAISSLQSSSSQELFLIGKAAAIATTTIDGIQAVQKALASAPPPLNFALAAAVGVATAANVTKIATAQPPKGYAQGGMVTGGIPGVDSVPIVAQRGELVTPTQNFDEVIDSVARARGYTAPNDSETNTDGERVTVNVVVQGDFIGDDNYINRLTERIKDAVRFNGASLA